VDIHGIVIPLENSASVLEGFREGNALTVVGETRNRGAPSGSRRLRDQRRENSFSISASLSSI
jgi:hypothetical protein